MAKHSSIPEEFTHAERGVRLQRFLADAGVAARRACERLIEDGHVEVNGLPVTGLPAWVDPEHDEVRVDGRRVGSQSRMLYVMLNKPKRTITAATDEPGFDRTTVTDLVNHPSGIRLFPVGRLDYDTVGLILLTNDGSLANALTHPRFGVPKTYRVVVRGRLEDEQIEALERGIYLAERKAGRTQGATRAAHVGLHIVRRDRERTILTLTLAEGRNRQVRRMLAAVGCPVRKLERIAMGPVQLKGLARGQWRELDRHEVRSLKAAARQGKKQPAKGDDSRDARDRGDTRRRRRKAPSPGRRG